MRERGSWFDVQNVTVGEGRVTEEKRDKKGGIQLVLFLMRGTHAPVCV